MLTVTMGDPAEVVATTPVVGTAMMTAMVMMATIMAMMVMMRRDGDAAVEGPKEAKSCRYDIYSSLHGTRSLVGLVLSAHNPASSWVSWESLPLSPCSGREGRDS